MHTISHITYEARLNKRFMNFVTLQPLVTEQAFMTYMKAMYVPFHFVWQPDLLPKGCRMTDKNVEGC